MNFKNTKVEHRVYGEGIITEYDGEYVKVLFGTESKTFQYPMAFATILKILDNEVESKIKSDLILYKTNLQRAKEEEAKAKAISEQELVILANNRSAERKANGAVSSLSKKKLPRVNVAFKCNFCDGGKTPERIGFSAICSDEMIYNNIINEKRTWCSCEDSFCLQYLNKKISRNELDLLMLDQDKMICYESRMLLDWKASAGIVQTGARKGEPMKLRQVQTNSLCVLTTREPISTEAERFIFAVFMVDKSYEGDNLEEGYVSTKSEYRIELTPFEAKSLLFWKYHANSNNPETPSWNSGLHRYFNDDEAVQILKDIASLKIGTKDESLTLKFLTYYCTSNKIDVNNIAAPKGAVLWRACAD